MIRGESHFESQLQPGVLWDSFAVPARWKDPAVGFRCVKEVH